MPTYISIQTFLLERALKCLPTQLKYFYEVFIDLFAIFLPPCIIKKSDASTAMAWYRKAII